jgi:peptidoglycan/xylan/chitin deacetylase (PgdA/CDA1 family)
MPRQIFAARLVFSLLVFCLATLFLSPAVQAQSPSNGLTLETGDATAVSGVVAVLGVAEHPTFRKWQLDLLLNGTVPLFLAFGEEPIPSPSRLFALDTRLYPDGEHQLRLRVVHSNLNYDEYFLPIRIANQSSSSPIVPAPSQAVQPAAQSAAQPAASTPPPRVLSGNGLSVVAQGDSLSVRGVADHPTFRKWQIDLLLNGDPNQAVFLGVGEKRVTAEEELLTLSPADYPAGGHQLRLRVVYGHLDYDEYLTPLVIGSGGMGVSSLSTTNRSRLVIRGPEAGKAIYLTFDDGPHSRFTPQILEVLAEYNAKATFFVVGRTAQNQGELIKKMYDAGHAIGNHSWSHSKLGSADWDTFEKEIDGTAQVLGGYGSHCLRPPYGDVGPNLLANAAEAGYSLIYWSVDPLDWLNQNPETIASRVLAKAQPGSIVLLHDGGDSRAGTVEALSTILATLSVEGYTFPALCR